MHDAGELYDDLDEVITKKPEPTKAATLPRGNDYSEDPVRLSAAKKAATLTVGVEYGNINSSCADGVEYGNVKPCEANNDEPGDVYLDPTEQRQKSLHKQSKIDVGNNAEDVSDDAEGIVDDEPVLYEDDEMSAGEDNGADESQGIYDDVAMQAKQELSFNANGPDEEYLDMSKNKSDLETGGMYLDLTEQEDMYMEGGGQENDMEKDEDDVEGTNDDEPGLSVEEELPEGGDGDGESQGIYEDLTSQPKTELSFSWDGPDEEYLDMTRKRPQPEPEGEMCMQIHKTSIVNTHNLVSQKAKKLKFKKWYSKAHLEYLVV